MSKSLLRVNNLTTRLASEAGWVHAIDDLSLTLEGGKTFALVGESGCGKSMTALSIARLLPDCGAILAGQVLLALKKKEQTDLLAVSEAAMRRFRGRRVAMIFQEPGTSLNPVMTVGDQLTEAVLLHDSVSRERASAIAIEWLDKVGLDLPIQRMKQYPFELSGGQKQRVMIAMALSVRPDVLIADEPTTALDVSIQRQVLDLLALLQRKHGMAMLLITHDLGVVQDMADHIGLMYAGQLVESAPAGQFFKNPRHPYAKALIDSLPTKARRGSSLTVLEGRVPQLIDLPAECRFASRCHYVQPTCTEGNVQLVQEYPKHWVRCTRLKDIDAETLPSAIGSAASSAPHAPNPSTFSAVLEVKELAVAYREKKGLLGHSFKPVLNGLDLALCPGKTLALVGESGSGKTTAARAILNLLGGGARISGEILYESKPLNSWPETGANGWRSKLQFVFQDPFASLNPRHRVCEILEEPLVWLRPDLSAQDRQGRIEHVVDLVSLPLDALGRYPHEFSGGQRQRIAIARALVSEPRVLICDEPTSALDVSVQAQILNLLRQLQHETGVSMLFITHNLAVVQYLADEVVVLRRGAVVERAQASALFEKPAHEYTQELIASAPLFRRGR